MEYNFQDKILTIGGKKIEFDSRISEIVNFDDLIVLVTEYYKSHTPDNVYGIDDKGEISWQIDTSDYKNKSEQNSAFTGLTKIDNSTIRLHNWDGTHIEVVAKTGQIKNSYLESRQGKRPW